MKKNLLSRRVGIVSYEKDNKRIQLLDYNVSYPLAKLALNKDCLIITGPFKKFKIKYSEIKEMRWRLFVGWDFGGIIIRHKNKKYPNLIGITNGLLTRTLYNEILEILRKNKIKADFL